MGPLESRNGRAEGIARIARQFQSVPLSEQGAAPRLVRQFVLDIRLIEDRTRTAGDSEVLVAVGPLQPLTNAFTASLQSAVSSLAFRTSA